MRTNDDLFCLIASLSRLERGYFSKYSDVHAKGGENSYKRLFMTLCTMEANNDEILKDRLPGDPLTGYLSTAKNQLYHTILKTMRMYSSEYSLATRMSDLLMDVDLLQSKALYNQQSKALRRAKEFSSTHEMILGKLEVSRREIQFFRNDDLLKTEGDDDLKELFRKRKTLMACLDEVFELEYLEARLFETMNSLQRVLSPDRLVRIAEIQSHSLLQSSEKLQTIEARIIFQSIHLQIGLLKRDWPSVHMHAHELLFQIRGKNDFTMKFPDRIFDAINGIFVGAVHLGRKKEALHSISMLRRLPAQDHLFKSDRFRILVFVRSHIQEMQYYLLDGDFRKWMDLVVFLQKEIPQMEEKVPTRMRVELYLLMSTGMFCSGEYRKALQFLNKVYSERFERLSRDFVAFCRIYYLLVHVELGNKDHLYYSIRSVSRKLEMEGLLGEFEKTIISYVRSQVLKGKRGTRPFDMQRLLQEVLILSRNPDYSGAFQFLDFTLWAQAKDEKITMQRCAENRRLSGKKGVTQSSVKAIQV